MKTCKLCGLEFPLRPVIDGKLRNFQRRKYCLDCSPLGAHNTSSLEIPVRKNRAVRVELECAFCKKPFIKMAKHIKEASKHGQTEFFCSISCAKRKNPIEVECHVCKKKISLRPSEFGRNKSGLHFCSYSCANSYNNRIYKTRERHPNWKDGRHSYRSFGLKEQCEDCGEKRYWLLIVHHRDRDRTKNEKEDLVTLCLSCHVARHLIVVEGRLFVRWNTLTTLEAKDLLEKETKNLSP